MVGLREKMNRNLRAADRIEAQQRREAAQRFPGMLVFGFALGLAALVTGFASTPIEIGSR